jgi:hypothetical protein
MFSVSLSHPFRDLYMLTDVQHMLICGKKAGCFIFSVICKTCLDVFHKCDVLAMIVKPQIQVFYL